MKFIQIANNYAPNFQPINYATQHFEGFIEFSEHYINQITKGEILTPKKVKFSASTIRQYKSAIDHFRNFEKKLPAKLKLYETHAKTLKQYEIYLIEQDITKNSIAIYISKIKAIINYAFEEELTPRPIKFSTPVEKTQKVYLSLSELEKINNNAKLSEPEKKIRDMFLVGCFTSLRHETLMKFLSNPYAYVKEFEGNSYIDITASKTNRQHIIPLSKVVVDALNRNNGRMEGVTLEYFNRIIKDVCRKSGIKNPIAETKTIGGETKEYLREKWKMVSSHTMRRTFISLAKQTNMPDREITGVTGHATIKQMNVYNRTAKIDQVKGIMKHDFFKIIL